MSDYEAIEEVGQTLIGLLRKKITGKIGISEDTIALASPGDAGPSSNVRLSLFLFQIAESGNERGRDVYLDTGRLRRPPLTLDLYYMMTAYPYTGQESGSISTDEHIIMGRAMQVFHDNAILSGSVLNGKLAEHNEELHVSIMPAGIDELTKIWGTFYQKPFRPSVCYIVSPVRIESERDTAVTRVLERRLDKYVEGGR